MLLSPPPLPLDPPEAAPLGHSFPMLEMYGFACCFSRLDLIDLHPADDARHRNWRIGFLVVHRGLNQREVAEAFGLSLRTVRRVARACREEGREAFFRKARMRGRVAVDAATARKAEALPAGEGAGGRSRRSREFRKAPSSTMSGADGSAARSPRPRRMARPGRESGMLATGWRRWGG